MASYPSPAPRLRCKVPEIKSGTQCRSLQRSRAGTNDLAGAFVFGHVNLLSVVDIRDALRRGESGPIGRVLCPLGTAYKDHVSGSGVGGGWVAAFSGMGRDDQRATAGSLMSGSSLIWLMVRKSRILRC